MRLESDTCFDVTSAAPAAAFVLAVSSAGLSSLGRRGGGGGGVRRERTQAGKGSAPPASQTPA